MSSEVSALSMEIILALEVDMDLNYYTTCDEELKPVYDLFAETCEEFCAKVGGGDIIHGEVDRDTFSTNIQPSQGKYWFPIFYKISVRSSPTHPVWGEERFETLLHEAFKCGFTIIDLKE